MSTKARIRRRWLALACVSCAAVFTCHTASGQSPGLSLTNSVWRYEQDRNMDGTGWQRADFNDDTWLAGLGLLGFEENPGIRPLIQTMLQPPELPAPGLPAPRTYYFRARFDYVHGDFSRPILVFSNRLDDGAVFYLNGVEVKRIRMADGPVTYVTQATNVPPGGDATEWDVFELDNPPLNWFPQANVLAVEVHQRGLSADIVFGCDMRIEYIPLLWPTPPFQVVTQCNTASISVRWIDAIGAPPASFQWFQNGIAIDPSINPTATNTTLTITNMQPQYVGRYHITVIYGRRLVTSDPAFVSFAVPPPDWRGFVRITKGSAGMRVNWDGCGILEHSTNLIDWSEVPSNPASPYDIPALLPGSLSYRIRR